MTDWVGSVPTIDWALIVALMVSALMAVSTGHRGRHFRDLPGWVAFWCVFSLVLVALSRTPPWISLVLLALLMFAGLRGYLSIVPLRPKDRSAALVAYLAIPIALYPGFTGSSETFLATIPVLLFLLFPALLALGPSQEGFFASVGRLLLGVLAFVFCMAHLALLVRWDSAGVLELYGVLVLAAELPQRLAGRFGQGAGWRGGVGGLLAAAVVASAAGYLLGPACGLTEGDGLRAGLLIALATALGAVVGNAALRDVGLSPADARVGRGAFLDRVFPAVYAAPVYFHYLNHFA